MATKRLFSDWNKEELEETFNLKRLETHLALEQWLEAAQTIAIEEVDTSVLHRLRKTLLNNADAWNAIELIEYCIGPLFVLVDFNTPDFKIFSERPISALVGDYELYGEPDALIASGHYSPKIPYFCFHEYKKENEPKGDPAAQVIAAMLAAQALNPRVHPIYGLYVVDKLWHFIVLQEHEYAISTGFLADDEEIFDIFKILKALKLLLSEIARQDG